MKNLVTIADGFKRSINLSEDFSDIDVLKGYICAPSTEHVVTSMMTHVKETGQASFTWTGPYGSGKSSLAVFFSALCSKDKDIRNIALNKLSQNKTEIESLLNEPRKGFAIVGSPVNPLDDFSKKLGTSNDATEILNKLTKLSQKSNILIFIDEMGKYLESASKNSDVDVYFFQQLAELANRSKGKVIFIGVLHQAFADYSRTLSSTARDEWTKIQGRFIDFSINTAGEEQINLISRAIISNSKPADITPEAKTIAQTIAQNKPIQEEPFSRSLTECWPLHPVTACLLGPASKKRFGQNQRSVFSFLSSAEPHGLQWFLNMTDASSNKNELYKPALFWDYLSSNLESSILASSDSKIWTLSVDGVDKCSVNGLSKATTDIFKTISLIEVFKSSSGLEATKSLLTSLHSTEDVDMSSPQF